MITPITSVLVDNRRMGLAIPYEIAYGRFERVNNVFVTVVDQAGRRGVGAASPEPEVTGETLQDVVAALRGPVATLLNGSSTAHRQHSLDAVARDVPGCPATLAAVEMALDNLWLAQTGGALADLHGPVLRQLCAGTTPAIRDLSTMVARAQLRVQQGFVQLKIKGGLDVDEDLRRVVAVRDAVGPDIALWFDANQGYSVAEALRFADGAAGIVALLEQPVPGADFDALAAVTARSSMPIYADEALTDEHSAHRLANSGAAHGVNIKLMKLGGSTRCRRIAAIAHQAGLSVMVGCMDESALAIAAAVALAQSLPGIVLADLDGDVDLLDDPYACAVVRSSGALRLAPAAA